MSAPDLFARWFGKAAEDLRAARSLMASEPPLTDQAAFFCQQAAEKGKAVLVRHGVDPERTHDLTRIARPVLALEPSLSAEVEPLLALTEWAVAPRYPDIGDQDLPEPGQVLAVFPMLEALIAAVRDLPPTAPRAAEDRL